jgi:hypothetical protein
MLTEFVEPSLEEALQAISQAGCSKTRGRGGGHSGLKRLLFWRPQNRAAPVTNHVNNG